MARSRLTLMALVAALVVVASACLDGSDFVFVHNNSQHTFAKVPRSWARYDATPPKSTSSTTWEVVFDGAATPDASHVGLATPPEPVGEIRILSLNQNVKDHLDLASMRAFATNNQLDPVQAFNDGDTSVEVLKNQDITTSSGARGNRVVFRWKQSDGSSVTIDQTAYVNKSTTTFYRFMVKCESTCYSDNSKTIDEMVTSFQVRA